LPAATLEALGIDDGDSWDTAVAKKPRKKKPSEDDEEYVNSVQPRSLDEDGVTKVVATLMQCKEKWIAVKLLSRLQSVDDDRVRNRVVQMHGYQVMKTTTNKISDSKIEATIEKLVSSDHDDVATESKRLLDEWSKLETAYRIPRKKFDPAAAVVSNSYEERRNLDREDSYQQQQQAKPQSPLRNVPKGPRSTIPQRNNPNPYFHNAPRQPRRPFVHGLPPGWFAATDQQGRPYYYSRTGARSWARPTAPAGPIVEAPKQPSKAQQEQKAILDIIDSLTKEPTPKPSAVPTPQPAGTPVQEQSKKEKWRSYPIEKQMKLYENTVSYPPILGPCAVDKRPKVLICGCSSYSLTSSTSWTSSDTSCPRKS
jgi:[histone H3]-lysine36 N-trimethyltransferase